MGLEKSRILSERRRIVKAPVTGNDGGVEFIDLAIWHKPLTPNVAAEVDAVEEPEGEDKDKQSPAIYEISENTLKVCIGSPERDRPTEFNSTAGYEQILVTLEREKK